MTTSVAPGEILGAFNRLHRYLPTAASLDGLARELVHRSRRRTHVGVLKALGCSEDEDWQEAKRIVADLDRRAPGYNQDPLFPTGQYYDPAAAVRNRRGV